MSNIVSPLLNNKKSTFVTVLAALSLGMAILSVISGLSTEAMILLSNKSSLISLSYLPTELHNENIILYINETINKISMLNRISTVFSIITIIPSWGLLKRTEWGRISFIALLIITSITMLIASIWGINEVNLFFKPEILAEDPIIIRIVRLLKAVLILIPNTITLFNLFFIWKLTRDDIVAEFN